MKNNNKKILILGAGEMQVPVIKECKKMGHSVIAVDYDCFAPGLKYADIALFISTIDTDSVYKAAMEYSIDGILTTSDFPVLTVAYVCEKTGLPGLSYNAATISTNKYLLREKLKENNVNTPYYKLIKKKSDLSGINCFPVIIKPVDSSASSGVKKVSSMQELENQYEITKSFSVCGDVIVEEFLEGSEYSVESLTQHGETKIIAITEKSVFGEELGFFVEDRHIIPANIDVNQKDAIVYQVLLCIKAVGINNSAAHTEVKLTANGAFIIEIGARLGGDFITSDLVPLATGVNMLRNVVKIAINEDIDVKQKFERFSGIQFLNTDNYYKAISLIHSSNIPGYIRGKVNDYSGKKIKNSKDRLGYVIYTAENRKDLLLKLNFDTDEN